MQYLENYYQPLLELRTLTGLRSHKPGGVFFPAGVFKVA